MLGLLRPLNLLFILLAQASFYGFIVLPTLVAYPPTADYVPALGWLGLGLVALSTALVAAGGYVINDYFDVKADELNRPKRILVSRKVSRRQALLLHWVLSGSGALLGAWLGFRHSSWILAGIPATTVAVLWSYSVWLKRKMLVGNLVVSLLCAMVIMYPALFEMRAFSASFCACQPGFRILADWTWIYAGFAFLATWVRELVKDIEDMKGDREMNCRTIPIVLGVGFARGLVFGLLVLLFGALAWLFSLELGRETMGWGVVAYIIGALMLPTALALCFTVIARSKDQWHKLATLVKIILLAGILSSGVLYLGWSVPFEVFP